MVVRCSIVQAIIDRANFHSSRRSKLEGHLDDNFLHQFPPGTAHLSTIQRGNNEFC